MDMDFGRYEILEEVARGAYGLVYRARDRELGRVVALKTLRREDAGAVARERFLREARIAARLDHPNVVRIFETGEHLGRPFYTMAFLEGRTLAGPLPPVPACRLVAQVARAVAHAHARGVVHRDLKPANILVCEGEPVVTDFGVAHDAEETRVTETGELVGTPSYMAPEQMRGSAKAANGKADVYALGTILFELLTGRLPFEADSFVELSTRALNDPAPDLVGFDPALADLVRRCLAKDPASRPSAEEMAGALERRLPGRPRRRALPLGLSLIAAGATVWAAASPPSEVPAGTMVRVPAGVYEIGDPRFGRRTVRLDEFWVDRQEAPARPGGYSYVDALGFCLRQGKRLPTEEEWEAAAGGRLFPWGDLADPARASCLGERGPRPGDVSPFGCQDMAGNLAEWTATAGSVTPETRVVRGGHWQSPLEHCTAWARQEVPLNRRLPTLGFRCAAARPGGAP